MQDCYDAPLTFSRGQYDTMMLALLRCVYTGRNDSQVLMSMEQALPVHHSWLNFNRYNRCLQQTCPSGLWVQRTLSKYADMKRLV